MHLDNQGYDTFLPLILKTRRHARKVETVTVALFPRYLFVRLDVTRDRWRSINGTVGVISLVMWSGRPQPVPEGIVETLIASTDERNVSSGAIGLRCGESVRVTAGPFAEILGVLDRLDDKGRARVMLDIMGGRVAVTLPRDTLVAAAG